MLLTRQTKKITDSGKKGTTALQVVTTIMAVSRKFKKWFNKIILDRLGEFWPSEEIEGGHFGRSEDGGGHSCQVRRFEIQVTNIKY